MGLEADDPVAGGVAVNPQLTRPGVRRAALPAPVASPIRGRDGELAKLGEGLDRLRHGAGAVVVIEGAAGMGKSRLLSESARIAQRLSMRVGLAAAEPSESVAELAPVLRALFDGQEPLLDRRDLSQLHAAPEQRYWRLQALHSLLERTARAGPMLILIDDLQWADSGTIAALRSLPLRLASRPIGWILALRPDQAAPHLGRLVDQLTCEGAERLVLDPLTLLAAAQVAEDVMQAHPDPGLLQMTEDAGGNPFLLVELLRGLQQEQLVQIRSGHATLLESRLPDRVRASMRERLARMPQPAGQVAEVAASLGRRFSFSDLAVMLGLLPAALLTPVERLIEAGILSESDDQLSFSHDLIREAVRHALARSARRALDRHAAAVMLERGALPVDVALQLAGSAVAGDDVAITTLLQASEALAATDPGASADLSRRALELAPKDHPLLGPLVAQTATSLHAAGRVEQAKAFADNALRAVLPAAQEAEVRLGIAGMWSVSPEARVHAGRDALKLAPLPNELRLGHMARLAYNLLVGGRPAEARVRLAEATKAGARRDPYARFQLALTEAGLEYLGGRFATALDMFDAVLREGFADGRELDELLTRLWRADTLLALDHASEALAAADSMIVDSQRRGLAFFSAVSAIWRGQLLLQTGRLHDAHAALAERFDAHAGPVVTVLDAAGVAALGRAAVHMTDQRQINRTSELAKSMIGESTPGVRRHAAWLLALQAMADRDPRRAHQWLCAPEDPERTRLLPRLWTDIADEPQMVRIALAAGDRHLAQTTAADARRRADLNSSVPSVQAAAAHAGALVNSDRAELVHAVDLFRQGPRPLALAAACEDLALVHRQHADQDSEVEALNEALTLFARAGAGHDASRLRNRLRELGIRRRLTTTDRPATGWAAMTKSELEVARLVTAGLTNREVAERLFVSPHTVSTHLRQVFAKLNVNSRVDLTRLATEREGQTDHAASPETVELL